MKSATKEQLPGMVRPMFSFFILKLFLMVQKSDHIQTLCHNLCLKLTLNSYYMSSAGVSITISQICMAHFRSKVCFSLHFSRSLHFEIIESEM